MILRDAQAALRCAEALLKARRLAEAATSFSEAERLGADPDHCAGSRWTCAMLAGDYEAAWQQSDALRARHAPDPHRVWDGTSLTGRRVMVRSVHGSGDAVQMLRYMPLIRKEAVRLTLQLAPALVELALCAKGLDEVVAWEEERPFDLQLEVTELPYIFRSTLDTLPVNVPYLEVQPICRASAQQLVAEKTRLRVGLVWTSSAWDTARSIPFSLLQRLLDSCENFEFWCLQPSQTSPEWGSYCAERDWPIRRAGDFSSAMFAACIAEMDLVITIDSFAAHLAGALARPVWVLLRKEADWRWMIDREDSPWYPTMRLFRQQEEGEWRPVLTRIAHELTVWAAVGNSNRVLR